MKYCSKRKYAIWGFLAAAGLFLTGCSRNTDEVKASPEEAISIVCTIFPQYDFVKEIIGDNPGKLQVSYLIDSGVDLHNYQPTVEDIITINNSDLFINVGGVSDAWVEDVLRDSDNDNKRTMALMDLVEVKEEEVVEGMEHDHEHHQDEENHDSEHHHDHDEDEHHDEDKQEEHHKEFDEHVWLSLKNAVKIVESISEAICEIDGANKEYYKENTALYIEELKKLDNEYKEMVEKANRRVILFGDRFPFRYLVDDYDIDYYAAFRGCSAETEASFETIAFLAERLEKLKLPKVFVLEGSKGSIAETIIKNSSFQEAKVAEINSLQSVTKAEIEKGASYLSIMKENLQVLREGLN